MLEKREFDKNDFLWRFFTAIAVVSGMFSVIVFTLLVVNYLQIRAADPVNNELITQMRIDYSNLPDQDDALAKRIQDLDLLTRKAFFISQEHLRIGATLLLISVCTFLISFKYMMRWKPEPPQLEDEPTAEIEFLAYADSRNLITWAGVGLLAVGMLASLMTESLVDPEAAMATAVALGNAPVAEEVAEEKPVAVAKEFPGWDAMQLNWPSFRGPGAAGVAHHTNAPTTWDVESGAGIRWKAETPLGGFNSPVIWGNKLFISGASETVREVYCYDTESGELLWTRTLDALKGTPAEMPRVNEETGYAASTMVAHGDQVFAIFANADIVSLDFDGNVLWGYNMGTPDNHYGHSSSLLAYGGLLYVQFDDSTRPRLVALNAANGETVWEQEREMISWSSPILAQTELGPQLILTNEEKVDAYNPETGELVWSQICLGGEVAPSPVYSNGLVFAANEFAVASAIQIGGTADAVETEILWEYDEYLPEVSSPIGDGERFYFGTSMGDLVSLDAKTGEELWAEETEEGFYSSPVLVGDRIYILDRAGNMYIVRASAEYEHIATIAMNELTFATPAFMDGRIYVRTETKLYCIE